MDRVPPHDEKLLSSGTADSVKSKTPDVQRTSQQHPSLDLEHGSEWRLKAIFVFQFIPVGIVFAYSTYASLLFFFDSVISHCFIMGGGLFGNLFCYILVRLFTQRYLVIIANSFLLLGLMTTFWTTLCIFTSRTDVSNYLCFFINGLSIGMLFGVLLPYLLSIWRRCEKDLWFWPHLGIMLGVCITEATISRGYWQHTLFAAMVATALSMIAASYFPRIHVLVSEPKPVPKKVMKSSTRVGHATENFMLAASSNASDRTRATQTSIKVILQHFTGLGFLAMAEIIGMNLAKDVDQCLRIFALSCLISSVVFRNYSHHLSNRLAFSSTCMMVVYSGLCFMSHLSVDSGRFYSQSIMVIILVVIGIQTAIGRFYLPMLDQLVHHTPELQWETVFVILTVWWLSGILFHAVFAVLLFRNKLYIMFAVMSIFCLIVTVISGPQLNKKDTSEELTV